LHVACTSLALWHSKSAVEACIARPKGATAVFVSPERFPQEKRRWRDRGFPNSPKPQPSFQQDDFVLPITA
jgi:hypothetical protein